MEGDFRAALNGHNFYREHAVGERMFVTHGVPLKDEFGGTYAALAVSYDVTEIKQAEAAASARSEDLEEISRRKDVFLATLAHELRNPLAPISLGVDLLRRLTWDNAQGEKTIAMLRKQVDHITSLVDDLLDLARISEGKVRGNFQLTSAEEIVQLAADASRPHIEAQGHTLQLEVPPGLPPLSADVTRMAQVLTNLLNNAAKFTPAPGKIVLRVAADDSSFRFSVCDNGPGIPEEKLGTIFDLYSQLGTTVNHSAQKGLGIGLAVVKKLTDLHGGSVGVESKLDEGCTFHVSLPRDRQALA